VASVTNSVEYAVYEDAVVTRQESSGISEDAGAKGHLKYHHGFCWDDAWRNEHQASW